MKVPLLDLKVQYGSVKMEMDSAIQRVVDSQYFILGPEVERFEREICRYLGCRFALGVSSGTDALLLALMALEVSPGSEVIVPDYSFFATAGVVSRLQAVPVFCDIDPVTLNIDPAVLERKITSKTRAIIPVHLFGQAAAMDEIMEIAAKHRVPIIEDAAQAIGASYRDGSSLGTIGRVGCFSFFPSKNLGCFGDGGLVVTDDGELYERMKILRVHGAKPKYIHRTIGGNFRMDALQAAVLSVKLPHLASWTSGRRRNAALYTRLFEEAGLAAETGLTDFDDDNRVLLPKAVFEAYPEPTGRKADSPYYSHIYNQYVIRVEQRDTLREFLQQREIGSEIYYPVPFHKQECFRSVLTETGQADEDFTISSHAADTSLALPVYPELEESQIRYVVETIKEFISKWVDG